MRSLPIHKFGIVVAYALVDDADYERLAEYHWRLDSQGYARRASGRRSINVSMHRDVLGPVSGVRDMIDHINGDKLDNRRENLRRCTRAENAQNQRKRIGVSSRYQGVTWNKSCGKWQAQIKVAGKSHYLGVFASEDEAGKAAAAFRATRMPFSRDARELDAA